MRNHTHEKFEAQLRKTHTHTHTHTQAKDLKKYSKLMLVWILINKLNFALFAFKFGIKRKGALGKMMKNKNKKIWKIFLSIKKDINIRSFHFLACQWISFFSFFAFINLLDHSSVAMRAHRKKKKISLTDVAVFVCRRAMAKMEKKTAKDFSSWCSH